MIDYINLSIAIAIIIGIVVITKFIFIYIKKIMHKFANKTKTELDDIIVATLEKPIYLAIVLFGIYFVIKTFIPLASYEAIVNKIFLVLFIFLIIYSLTKITNVIFFYFIEKRKQKKLEKTSLNVIRRTTVILIWVIGLLITLDIFGIAISPFIASLGIGGLAIALALQDTLSNYFAGIYITTDKTIKVGDYIELDNGIQGYVEEIGWRSTRIRTLPNNIVIVPNSKIATSILTNYYKPFQEMSVVVPVGVSYNSDLEKVEKVTIQVAKKILKKIPGAVPDFEPFIRYKEFGDSSINFSVILRVKEYTSKYLVVHEFIKELKKAYDKEGIEIPFPQRVVHLHKK